MAGNTCGNPLLLEWIKEWLDHAEQRNSKGVSVSVSHGSFESTLYHRMVFLISFYRYKKAYNSMKACPLIFNDPSEAQQLNGLGPKLCDRLTTKLNDYCKENGLPIPEAPHQGKLLWTYPDTESTLSSNFE